MFKPLLVVYLGFRFESTRESWRQHLWLDFHYSSKERWCGLKKFSLQRKAR